MKKLAVPNDVLAMPPSVVGCVGGFSWAFVRVAVKITPAFPLPANRTVRSAGKVVRSRNIDYPLRGNSLKLRRIISTPRRMEQSGIDACREDMDISPAISPRYQRKVSAFAPVSFTTDDGV
jgi:hypothetical protein